ncbi:MAG: asparaginase [Proteobacteria bacterium]|nr:asparaginase [Pseudomonadota bacterium]
MKRLALIFVFFAFSLIHPMIVSAEGPQNMPHIVIVATGGTIAGIATSSTETKDYKPGVLDVGSLIKSVPGIEKVAKISGEQIANIDSSHITNDIWLKLANRVNELLLKKEIDGIVITHGTDTMEETAYFLNLVIKGEKPVVLTGSMRPSTAISADGPLNLFNAVVLASSKDARGKGVLVALNENIHGGRDVTKTNTTSVATFTSREFGCLGYVLDSKVYFFRETNKKHTTKSEFSIQGLTSLPRVDILYGHTHDNRDLADASVKAGAKGIVHAGAGNGGIFPSTKDALKEAIKKGVAVVRASRTGSGIVTPSSNYDNDGFVAAGSLNPQKARILLMLALTGTNNPAEIRKIFDEY